MFFQRFICSFDFSMDINVEWLWYGLTCQLGLHQLRQKFVLLPDSAGHFHLPVSLPLFLHMSPHLCLPDHAGGLGVLGQLCHRGNVVVQPGLIHCWFGLSLCCCPGIKPLFQQIGDKGCFSFHGKNLEQVGSLHTLNGHLLLRRVVTALGFSSRELVRVHAGEDRFFQVLPLL